jgi:hypothetical protein
MLTITPIIQELIGAETIQEKQRWSSIFYDASMSNNMDHQVDDPLYVKSLIFMINDKSEEPGQVQLNILRGLQNIAPFNDISVITLQLLKLLLILGEQSEKQIAMVTFNNMIYTARDSSIKKKISDLNILSYLHDISNYSNSITNIAYAQELIRLISTGTTYGMTPSDNESDSDSDNY